MEAQDLASLPLVLLQRYDPQHPVFECSSSDESRNFGDVLEPDLVVVQSPLLKSSIIDLASVASRSGVANASLHATGKSAVDGLTKSAALDYSTSGIRANAVAAPLTPGGGSSAEAGNCWAATLEETSRTIVFLGSDGAAYLIGQSVLVDGAHAPPRESGVYDAAPGTVH